MELEFVWKIFFQKDGMLLDADYFEDLTNRIPLAVIGGCYYTEEEAFNAIITECKQKTTLNFNLENVIVQKVLRHKWDYSFHM